MQIIDNSEYFEGLELHAYVLSFHDLNDAEIKTVEYHLDDCSWEAGLAISEASVEQDNNVRRYIFTSPKKFESKEEPDWTNEDLETNKYTRIVGKEQFFSSIFADTEPIESKTVTFSTGGQDYRVEFSKYSELQKI